MVESCAWFVSLSTVCFCLFFVLGIKQNINYICIHYPSGSVTAHSIKNKYWWMQNYVNVSVSDMSTSRLLFQWARNIKIKLGVLVKYKVDIISWKCSLFSSWYSWNIALLALNNNLSLADSQIDMKDYISIVNGV
jgi:hypothetical protein